MAALTRMAFKLMAFKLMPFKLMASIPSNIRIRSTAATSALLGAPTTRSAMAAVRSASAR